MPRAAEGGVAGTGREAAGRTVIPARGQAESFPTGSFMCQVEWLSLRPQWDARGRVAVPVPWVPAAQPPL